MTKGHNKEENRGPKPNSKGQDRHLKESKKNKSPQQGRNREDQSYGTKGENNI